MGDLYIDVNRILSFFDEDLSVSKHASAIKAVFGEEFMFGLLLEYCRRSNIVAEKIDDKCTTGMLRGPRLDGWVKAQRETDPEPTYCQVEVKLWSAHGVASGARVLRPGDDLADHKREVWKTYWSNGRFIEDALNKVLTPMKCPSPEAKVRPLACLWSPVHPEGSEDPFFEVKPEPSAPFPAVWVFSASSFLRNIKDKEPRLKLNLPEVKERLRLLNAFFDMSCKGFEHA